MNISVRGRRAFTLVELLVVIAIIGVLVALLLPAVQAAREAARRSSCGNNMRQQGIAVHNFHDIYNRLPPQGATDLPPFGTGGGWGSSWLVRILPYMEQGAMFDKMLFNGGSGWGASATNNNNVANNIQIKSYFCPSSPLNQWCSSPHNAKIMAPTYVAIMGATNEAFLVGTTQTYTELRIANGGSGAGCCTGGRVSDGGAFRRFGQMSMAGLTDGTTNVLMIGEHGNFYVNVDGAKVDYRSGGLHGWIIGWHTTEHPSGNGGDMRTFNATTIRYKINHFSQKTDNPALPAAPGNCGTLGVCDNASSNGPLNAGHPGGVQGVLGDASVRFFSQTMPLDLLARYATRDDGLPVQD